jgi:hypothetical protein
MEEDELDKRNFLNKRHVTMLVLLRQYINPWCGGQLVVGAFDQEVAKQMVDSGWDVTARYVRSTWQTNKQSILSPELHHHDVSQKKGSG